MLASIRDHAGRASGSMEQEEGQSPKMSPKQKQKATEELFRAARDGDCEQLGSLLDAGVYVDTVASAASDDTVCALVTAVDSNQESAVKLLLSHGADTNLYNIACSTGWTPLMTAAFEGFLPSVQELMLAPTIDVSAVHPAFGATALHFACATGFSECAELLVLQEADMKLKDANGDTVLDAAGNAGHTEVHAGMSREVGSRAK